MNAYLEAQTLSARHPGADSDAVRDTTLLVQKGEIIALTGPNGSGKSTLISALAGELPLRRGRVCLKGESIHAMHPRARARQVARLPQMPIAPAGLTVGDLVATGRYAWRGAFTGLNREDRRAIQEALYAVGLEDLHSRPLERLSGGERRRAWISMVLAQQAPIMMLDEPTAALDARHQIEVLEHLTAINRERDVTIVVALHDLEQAALFSDRVAVMLRGRLYASGPPEEILTPETFRDAFGVEAQIYRNPTMNIRITSVADPVRGL